MEAALLPAPPLSAASAPNPTPSTTTTTNTSVPPNHISYTDSVDSSPRSRNTDSWEELPAKLRLMCSYGGQIVPRPHDKSLCYVGGDTRIVVVERNSTLPDLVARLSKILLNGHPFILKYQLPNEDLDSLITVSTEEDLDNMIDEYDRLIAGSNPGKSARLRLFLFPTKPESAASMSILEGSNKSEGWFLNMLNGDRVLQRGFSEPTSVDCLLGLDGKVSNPAISDMNSKDLGVQGDGKSGKLGNHNQSSQDVQSVPDSPMIENTSSFDSTSSSPSLGTLPPIQVHVEEGSGGADGGSRVLDPRVGIEEQFSQICVGTQQKRDEGFVVLSSPHTVQPNMAVPTAVTGAPAASEMSNRIVSDDDISDHGVPVGYRKPPQQPQMQPMIPSQLKQQTGGELTSPDSVSSDSSFSNRQKTVIYQDQISGGGSRVSSHFVDPKVTVSDPSTGVQMQQISESGYALLPQYDQQQHLFLQQQQHQQQTQSQPQFIHAGAPYIQHHPAGGYYPVYLSQQTHHPHPQLDQRYPVYYVPSGQAQAYNFPGQQASFGEPANGVPSTLNQNPPNPTMISTSAAYNPSRNVQPANQEMAAGVYRAVNAVVAPLAQVPSNQHQHQHQSQAQQKQQFVGYTQMHHPTQSMPPTSAAAYAYEFSDPAHAQVYFSQPLAPQLAAQYKTMTPSPVVLPDASAQLPTDSIMQQIRTSQAL